MNFEVLLKNKEYENIAINFNAFSITYYTNRM